MKERIVEIINFLIKRVLRDTALPNESELVQDLISKGYHPAEIDAAFGFIFSSTQDDGFDAADEEGNDEEAPRKVRRVLNYLERFKLTVEAQGLLIGLTDMGLIRPEELEEVLMEAISLDMGEVGMEELRWLLNRVVSDEFRLAMISGATWARTLFDEKPTQNIN